MRDRDQAQQAEVELLALARRGDIAAFEQIVIRYERRVFGLALRMTGSTEDAKDATQETFILLHRKMAQITSGQSLGAWLYTVATNVCRNIARNRRRARVVSIKDSPADTAVDPSPNPERVAAAKQREDQLLAALQTLPEKERAALLLREMEGLSTEEVAQVLGSSPATVRAQICSARLKLRRYLAHELPGL